MERKKRKRQTAEQKPYTDAEVQAIVDLLELPQVEGGKPEWTKPANYWVPLIALFSGMRQGEICQLYKQDIIEAQGCHCIEVTDRGNDQNLKFRAQSRYVPIHSTLLGLGFLEYVQQCKTERLFPDIQPRMDSYAVGWKWFARKIAPQVSREEGKSFQSIRNGVEQRLVESHPERLSVVRMLMGRAEPDGAISAKGNANIAPLKEVVETIDYPGVSFERLRALLVNG